MYPVKQSTALTVPVFGHDVNGDAVTGMTDGGFTKRISKNGGAFAAMTVTITELENGWYSIPLGTGHTDTVGILSLTFTNASSKQINTQFRVHTRLSDDLAFPTTSGNSIDVTAAGEVGLDLDNTSGTIAAAQIATDAITSAKIAAGAITSSEAPNLDAAVSSRLAPTVAARTLDVAVTGEAGVDWANVGGQATAVNLSATTTNLVNTTTTNTDMVGTDLALLAASAPTNFGDLSIVVSTGLVDITQAAADKVWSTATRTLTAFSTALALSIWDVLETAILTASSIGLKLKNNLDVVLSTRATPAQVNTEVDNALNTAIPGGPTADSINQRVLAIDDLSQAAGAGDLAAILTDTGTDGVLIGTGAIVTTSFAAGAVDAAAIAASAIGASELAADAVTEIRDAILPVSNTALSNIEFLFVSSVDHVTPVTGATGISGSVSINGAAFAAVGGAIAEVANGIYQFDASAADMNGGMITFRFLATGGTPAAPDDTFLTIVTGIGV